MSSAGEMYGDSWDTMYEFELYDEDWMRMDFARRLFDFLNLEEENWQTENIGSFMTIDKEYESYDYERSLQELAICGTILQPSVYHSKSNIELV